MQVVTGYEMQTLEKKAFANLGLSPLLVMENAGSRIVETLKAEYGNLSGKRIHILAGTGNNGGDGLVAARQLLALGARVKVYLVGDQAKATKENRINREVLKKLQADFTQVEAAQIGKLKFSLGLADLIIDAVFGTGFSGSLSPDLESLVEAVNEINRPLIAIDCPTGVNCANGHVLTHAIKADLTINLGFLKMGCVLYPGQKYAGKSVVVDLGFPLAHQGTRFLLDDSTLSWLPDREPWSHKGTFGHTLVVAGSQNYAGAAYLSAQAVLGGGGGMVTLAVPGGIYDRFRPDELIVTPVSQTEEGTIGEHTLPELVELLENKDVLAIGPGLTRMPQVLNTVQKLLQYWSGPCVIDADALWALSSDFLKNIAEDQRRQWILTPHPGEMARLVTSDPAHINANRLEIAEDYARKWNVVVVLKGAPTIVASPAQTFINSTGNHGMATAGSGDVLTGLISSLLSQGLEPSRAGAVGVYVHGKTGDLAGQKGLRGLRASDLLAFVQEALS